MGQVETVVLATLQWFAREKMRNGESAYLEVAELRKLLATVVESAEVRLGLFVHDLMSSYVATLSKEFSADFTPIWPLPSVSSLVSLPRSR